MKAPHPKIALVAYVAVLFFGLVQADNIAEAEQVCLPGDETCVVSNKFGEASIGIDDVEINKGSVAENVDFDGVVLDTEKNDEGDGEDYWDRDDDDYDDDDDDFEFEGEDEGDDEDEACVNNHELCEFWASSGECKNNQGYMLKSCQKSCKTCKKPSPSSHKAGHGAAYGEPQELSGEHKDTLLNAVEKMDKYMNEEIVKPEYDKVRSECKNRNALCLFWAHIGECENNPSFMLTNCAPSCETCQNIDFDYRCPKDPNHKDVFEAGDLHKMFERIVKDFENVTVLSQPPTEGEFKPWVITVDDFITDEECERLIELGGKEGYERSTDVGAKKFDGTFEAKKSKTRTSENAWCNDDCFKDPLVQTALKRIELLTGVPDSHSEYLQLLKYETGQFYRTHHDYIEHDDVRPQGPRILTAFLYLNDVEAGGGTNFPDLDLTVMPKKGRLLLWPSVIDNDPSKKDFTTRHQALDVEAGEKYGANSWLHLRNFKIPHEAGCT